MIAPEGFTGCRFCRRTLLRGPVKFSKPVFCDKRCEEAMRACDMLAPEDRWPDPWHIELAEEALQFQVWD